MNKQEIMKETFGENVGWKAKKILENFGNSLNDQHQEGVRAIGRLYRKILFEGKSGRFAVPMPTGTGKTTTIIALCERLEDCGFDRGLMVCAEKVEALCELKRDLLAQGVPEAKIGLVHGYKHDPDFDRECPVPNTASEESIPDSEIGSRPYLLVTHERLRKANKLEKYGYQGKPRDLTIWDESLIAADGWSISLKELQKGIGEWRGAFESDRIMGKEQSQEAHLLHGYFLEVSTRLGEVSKNLGIGQEELVKFEHTELYHKEREALQEVLGGSYKGSVLNQFLDVIDLDLRAIRTSESDAFIHYEIVIPDKLDNVVVLDASYPIRELAHIDDSIQMVETGFKKSYEDVRVHCLESRSGRSYIEGEFEHGYNNTVASEVCEIVEQVQRSKPGEGVLIFTFKKKKIDIVEGLKTALRNAGVDVEAKDAEGRNLINFLTWGMETSLNSYSHCEHVIFAGVLHLPLSEVAASAVGQKRSLEASIEEGEINRIHFAEQAHFLYQALSRGSCRHTDTGKALAMDVYLFHHHLNVIQPLLSEVMPGVQWLDYEPRFLTRKEPTKADQLADQIRIILDESGDRKVSSKVLKQMLENKKNATITPSQFRKAGDRLNERGGWVRQGRSFVKSTMTDEVILGDVAE